MTIRLLFLLFSLCSFTAIASDRYSYEEALRLYQQRDFDTSFVYLRNILHTDENNLPAKILLAQVLLQNNRFQEAIAIFQDALDQGADINLLIDDLSQCYLAVRDYHQLLTLGRYSNLTPSKRFHWLLNSSFAYHQLGDAAAAEHSIREAERIDHKHPRLITAKARHALQQHQFDEAEQLIQAALKDNPNHAEAWQLKGDSAHQQAEFPDALTAYSQANKLDPDNPFILRSLSAAYIAVGDFNNAQQTLVQMRNLGLDEPYLQFSQAIIDGIEHRPVANSDLKALHDELTTLPIEYFNQHPQQLYLRAAAAYLLGAQEQALRDFEIYLQLMPSDTDTIALVTEIYRQTRERSQTLRFLEAHHIALQTSPSLLAQQVLLNLELERLQAAEALIAQARAKYPTHHDLILLDAEIRKQLHGADSARQFLNQLDDAAANSQLLLSHALLAMDLNDLTTVIELAKELVSIAPDNADHLNLLAGALAKAGQLDQAQQVLNQLFELDASYFPGQLSQANLWFVQRQYQKAYQLLQDMLTREPRHHSSMTLLAATKIALQRDADAEQQLIDLLNRNYFRPAADLLVELYVQQKRYNEARAIVQRGLRQQFMAKDLLLKEADILVRQQQHTEAKQVLSVISELPDLTGEVWFAIAQIQQRKGDMQAAEFSFSKAVALSPDIALYRLELAQALLHNQQLDEAHRQIQQLYETYPDDANVLRLEADLQLQQGLTAKAFQSYLAAIVQDPYYQRAWASLYELARHAEFMADFEQAAERYRAIEPNFFWLTRLLAEHFINHQKYQQAATLYTQLLEQGVYNEDAGLLNNLAYSLLEDAPEQALPYAQKAAKLASNHVSVLTTYAKVLSVLKQHEQALSVLRQAYALDSAADNVRYLTAVSLINLERETEAKTLLLELLKQQNNVERQQQYRALLDTIE